MNYLMLICAEGETAPDAIGVMQRELPAWIEEMNRRGVRLGGRELELPDTAVTLRVRGGETLVTDGPFAETKEFVAGFDVLECQDLDEAIEVAAASPVARFHTIEIRPFAGELRVTEAASAFGRGEDSAGTPYLLTVWAGGAETAPVDDEAAVQNWQQDLEARGVYVLGDALKGTDTATTLRVLDGDTRLSDGPFTDTEEFIARVDVVSCADRQQAIELAASHPLARRHAIEVRPFWSE